MRGRRRRDARRPTSTPMSSNAARPAPTPAMYAACSPGIPSRLSATGTRNTPAGCSRNRPVMCASGQKSHHSGAIQCDTGSSESRPEIDA